MTEAKAAPAFWGDGKIECKKCGRVWYLTKHSLIQRDPDSVECRCGETLHSWNGAVMYTAELIKPIPGDQEHKEGA